MTGNLFPVGGAIIVSLSHPAHLGPIEQNIKLKSVTFYNAVKLTAYQLVLGF
jgi:hypothetical protein